MLTIIHTVHTLITYNWHHFTLTGSKSAHATKYSDAALLQDSRWQIWFTLSGKNGFVPSLLLYAISNVKKASPQVDALSSSTACALVHLSTSSAVISCDLQNKTHVTYS